MRIRTPLERDTKVGQYKIIDLMGEGGSALVYHAVDEGNKKLHILKELYPRSWCGRIGRSPNGEIALLKGKEYFQDGWQAEKVRFLKEAENYSQLQSHFAADIVGKYDAQISSEYTFFSGNAFEANNTVYIPIETGNGKTLRVVLSALRSSMNKSFIAAVAGLGRVVSLLITLCDAVEQLHVKGYLHLDLKPDNLFITERGNLKMLDMGSLLPVGNPGSAVSFTPGFSAPELIPGEEIWADPSVRSDVYSIAAILCCALFGSPFSADGEAMRPYALVLRKMSRDEIPSILAGFSSQTIELFLRVIGRGMARHPDNRYQDVGSLHRELETLRFMIESWEGTRVLKNNPGSAEHLDTQKLMKKALHMYGFIENMGIYTCTECACAGDYKKSCDMADRFSICSLMREYEKKQLQEGFGMLKEEVDVHFCINFINEILHASEYRKAFFLYNLLMKNAPLADWKDHLKFELYDTIGYCYSLFSDQALQKEFWELADGCKVPRQQWFKAKLRRTFALASDLENSLDFEGMAALMRKMILLYCDQDNGDDDAAAVDAFCHCNLPIETDLVRLGGRYAEALCLSRCENWQGFSKRILEHSFNHMENKEEATFRMRTVDNLLHLAVENENTSDFLYWLRYLPEPLRAVQSPMYPQNERMRSWTRENAVDDGLILEWLASAAELFSDNITEDYLNYPLYLFLKSISSLFIPLLLREMDSDAAQKINILCGIIISAMVTGNRRHPWELILKHAALISHAMGNKEYALKAEQLLFDMIDSDRNGLVQLIIRAALMKVEFHRGSDYWQDSLEKIAEAIRVGKADGLFAPGCFNGALDNCNQNTCTPQDCMEVLSRFRFKHA